jgi:hypothetical protein
MMEIGCRFSEMRVVSEAPYDGADATGIERSPPLDPFILLYRASASLTQSITERRMIQGSAWSCRHVRQGPYACMGCKCSRK